MTSDQFWEGEFADRNESHDFAGRLVRKNEYGVRTECGWTVDHILPQGLHGPDEKCHKKYCVIVRGQREWYQIPPF